MSSAALSSAGLAHEITAITSEMGRHPVYVHEVQGQRVALFHPGVGAPLAAGILEEVIALGCRRLIACGGAGVLDREIAAGHVVVPTAAVRDEGTSYHYLPPSREAPLLPPRSPPSKPPSAVATWTIGWPRRGRPTPSIARRANAWRCAAPKAAPRSRWRQLRSLQSASSASVTIGQILYGGDNLDADEWDSRDWDKNVDRPREVGRVGRGSLSRHRHEVSR